MLLISLDKTGCTILSNYSWRAWMSPKVGHWGGVLTEIHHCSSSQVLDWDGVRREGGLHTDLNLVISLQDVLQVLATWGVCIVHCQIQNCGNIF